MGDLVQFQRGETRAVDSTEVKKARTWTCPQPVRSTLDFLSEQRQRIFEMFACVLAVVILLSVQDALGACLFVIAAFYKAKQLINEIDDFANRDPIVPKWPRPTKPPDKPPPRAA
jgi:hypothetical protein